MPAARLRLVSAGGGRLPRGPGATSGLSAAEGGVAAGERGEAGLGGGRLVALVSQDDGILHYVSVFNARPTR